MLYFVLDDIIKKVLVACKNVYYKFAWPLSFYGQNTLKLLPSVQVQIHSCDWKNVLVCSILLPWPGTSFVSLWIRCESIWISCYKSPQGWDSDWLDDDYLMVADCGHAKQCFSITAEMLVSEACSISVMFKCVNFKQIFIVMLNHLLAHCLYFSALPWKCANPSFQISSLPESISEWPRLKVLRLEENCLEITALTPKIMKESQIALLAVEGNVFDMKKFNNVEGYDEVQFNFSMDIQF